MIANVFLTQLRKTPSLLDAMTWINRDTVNRDRTFQQLVDDWKKAAPANLRKVIDDFVKPLRQLATCPSKT
jgi:hypothetical protein